MKNFSLFSGLGVFVCLSVGERIDEWVLGQIKRAHKFDESKLYVLCEEQHIYVWCFCVIRFSGCYYHSGVPCLVSVPPVLIYLFICPSEKVNLKTPANFKLGFVMFR